MSKYLFILLLLLGITAKANAQEMMLNGSFEDCDGVAPPGTPYLYSIEYGAYWHNLTGTADLVNPCVTGSSGAPCFGVGCGRFGINGSGYSEYLYGQTLPLTAGQIYEVSFWIHKDYPTETLRKVGLAITETVPVPSITSTTPLISEVISSTQCVKLKACFTAQNNVTHYVTIGPFQGEGSPEPILYLVDSVSVLTIPPGTPLAQASLSASEPVLCSGEQVTLDGTASANETSYEWNIYNITNGNNLFYSSGIIQGTAGTLTPTLSFPIPGSCYRAELTVYGVCKDVATVEFCIADPDIDFVFDGNPVCENFPVDLQVTGDNGWIYTWQQANDTLNSGVGLKTLTVTPTLGNATYSVTVTTPEGCTHTETLTLNVNSQTNIAPWMDGINGTGEYTYYVSQGDAVFFNSVLSNDHSNEQIDLSTDNNIPSGFIAGTPGPYGGIFSFSWATSLNTPPGEYYYRIEAIDDNACDPDTSVFKFRIIVVCDQCPVCIDYEDRLPGNNPLPPVTKAGKCIEAGITDTVSTGDNVNVTFQAGAYILEGPHFYAGPGYEAIIDTTTCVLGCEDCCVDFNGFTVDLPIPNIFSPNGDGINDMWFVRDDDHPWCAFGATGFELYIVNVLELNVYQLIDYRGTGCCPFRALYPNPSSIYWDGKINVGTGKGQQVPDGVYFYVLYLHGCGQTATYNGNISIYTTPAGMAQNNDPGTQLNSGLVVDSSGNSVITQPETRLPDDHFYVFPNPTDDFIRIHSGKTITQVCVFDGNGKQVITLSDNFSEPIDLSPFGVGTYRIKALFSDNTIKEQIIVKE